MHQMNANLVSNHNNIDTDSIKAVRNVKKIEGDGIKENRNLCVLQAVLDVINISGQWETLKDKTEHCCFYLALMKKMNELN